MTFKEKHIEAKDIQPAQVTVMQSTKGRRLTKYFSENGMERYDNTKWFKANERTLRSFEDLSELLFELESRTDRMIVTGSVADHCLGAARIQRLAKDRPGEKATLVDHGSRVVHFDVDEIPIPDGFGWHNTEELARATWSIICARVPALADVSVHWQASSSAGTSGNETWAKFHFWLLLDTSIKTAARKSLFEMAGSDKRLALISQPNFTAAPVFDGVPDPLHDQPRSGVITGRHEHARVADISLPKIENTAMKDRPAKPKVGGCQKVARSSGGKHEPTGQNALDWACSAILQSEQRNNEINKQAFWIGGLVAGGQIDEFEAQSALLDAAKRSGHDRYEEAVFNGFSDGREKPIFARAPSVLSPYYPPQELPRDEAIRVHAETIQNWGKRAITCMRAIAEVRGRLSKLDPLKDDYDAESLRIRQNVQARFDLDWLPSSSTANAPLPRVMLTGAQGVGKTSTLVGRQGAPGVLHDTGGLISIMYFPTHKKAAEAASDYRRNASSDGPKAMTVLGRGADDPQSNDGTKMCPAIELATAVNKKGLSVRQSLCPICPFSKTCGHLRQERDLESARASGKGAVLFAAHDYAFLPLPANIEPDLKIFDERPRDFGVEHISVPVADLKDVPELKVASHVIEPVFQALVHSAGADPDQLLRSIRAAGITGDMLDEAADELTALASSDLPDDIEADLQNSETQSSIIGLAARLNKGELKNWSKVRVLVEVLAREIRTGQPDCSAVVIEADKAGTQSDGVSLAFQISRTKTLRCDNKVPFLHIDGTGDVDIARVLFGTDLRHHHYPVERNAHVIQVRGCKFSKRYVCGEKNSSSGVDGDIGRKSEELRRYLQSTMATKTDLAVFANKSVIQALGLESAPHAGHFNALRGMNTWSECQAVMVIGREQPGPKSIEKIARAFASAMGDAFTRGAYVVEQRGVRMRDGSAWLQPVQRHPDPWGDRILRQIRDAEIEQAIDRVRLIHNKELKQVYLLSPVVIDITVDEWADWRHFRKGGTRIERAVQNSGIIPLSPRECSRLLPELWSNPQTASADLKKAGLTSNPADSITQFKGFDVDDVCRVSYRAEVPPPGRARRHEAIIFSKPDAAQSRLETVAGALREFTILGSGPSLNAV